MSGKTKTFSPLWPAALSVLLLMQTGISVGGARRFEPPVRAPSFSLPGLDGGRHALADFRGRPLLLSVWASWCAPCRYELPEFQRARDALAAPHPDAVFMTVNVGESGARAKTWMDRQELDLPVLLASDRFVDQYAIISIPAILVFDRDGRLAVIHDGWVMGTDLAEELAKDLESLGRRASD
jgi:thiol-disulfide isomerase/thioredoxin